MFDDDGSTKVIPDADVRRFFHASVHDALHNQHIDADEHTVVYIVNVLTGFTHTEDFYEKTPEGLDLKPLALIFSEALAADNAADRTRALKRLGDVSLYVSGFFAESLVRRTVGIDYFINMGGSAYGSLSDIVRNDRNRGMLFGNIFEELAHKFEAFVDVLSEISERSSISSNQDVLRLYDTWIRTGSKRIEGLLAREGIHPTDGAKSGFEH